MVSLRQRPVLLACLLALITLRIWYHLAASPLPDEAYYWLWGRWPALSYFDHPPLQAWMQGLVHALFGTNTYALRLPAVLTSAVVVMCMIWWGRRFGQHEWDIAAGLTVVMASPLVFLLTGMAFNDHLLIALLSLATIQLFLLFEGQLAGAPRLRHLYLAAVLIGLAGLTKYNAALFALGAFAMIAATPGLRPVLRNPHLYLAALVTLACLSPVFWWNLQHSGASFRYNLSDRIVAQPGILALIGREAGFVLAFVLTLSPWIVAALLRPRLMPPDQALLRRIGLWIFGVATLICMGVAVFVPVIYYWNVIAVVALLPLMAVMLRSIWPHLIYGLVINLVLVFNHTIFPLAALQGRADPESALMYGWPQISAAVTAQTADFILTTDYRTGAILAYWLDDPHVGVIAKRVSQFSLWFDPAAHLGQEALILTSNAFPLTSLITARFAQIKDLGAIEVTRAGFGVTRYHLYRGIGFHWP